MANAPKGGSVNPPPVRFYSNRESSMGLIVANIYMYILASEEIRAERRGIDKLDRRKVTRVVR